MNERQESLPLVIKNLEKELLSIQIQKASSKDEASRIRMMYAKDIEEKYAKTNISELSNQTKRNIAVEDLLEVDERYQELLIEIKALEIDSKIMTIDLNYEKRIFEQKMKSSDPAFGHLEYMAHHLKRIADALESK